MSGLMTDPLTGKTIGAIPATPTKTVSKPVASVQNLTWQEMQSLGFPQSQVAAAKIAQTGTLAPLSDGIDHSQDTAVVGAGGGTGTADTTAAARASTQKSIDALQQILANKLANAQDQYQQVINQYNDEDALNQKQYDDQTTSNEQNRTNTIQAALLAAAQGGQGLRATLASLGALGGTGSVLANRAIASGANQDIGGANNTFDTNAKTLDTSWAQTQQDEKNRRAQADTDLANAKLAAQGDVATQAQTLYKDLANLWSTAGNSGQAASALAQADTYLPQITAASRTATPTFTPQSAVFSPGTLASYLAGNNDMSVQTAGGDQTPINSPLYALTKKRDISAS